MNHDCMSVKIVRFIILLISIKSRLVSIDIQICKFSCIIIILSFTYLQMHIYLRLFSIHSIQIKVLNYPHNPNKYSQVYHDHYSKYWAIRPIYWFLGSSHTIWWKKKKYRLENIGRHNMSWYIGPLYITERSINSSKFTLIGF